MSVNRRMTAKRVRETRDYAAMMRRLIRAHGRRVADGDYDDLRDLVALREDLEAAIDLAVTAQRDRLGYSWADVARGLGTTRQYAQRRYGKAG